MWAHSCTLQLERRATRSDVNGLELARTCGFPSVKKRSQVHVGAAVLLRLINCDNHRRHQVNSRQNVGFELLTQIRRFFAAKKSHPDIESIVAEDKYGAALLER